MPHLSFVPLFPFLSSFLFLLSSLFLYLVPANAQTTWTVQPFNPPSVPLAVKNPYLNAWAPLGDGSVSSGRAWPRTHDNGLEILGWYAAVRVDGKPYKVLGDAGTPNATAGTQKSLIFTPTQTSYLFDLGGDVSLNMTFVTPLEANDLVRLSMPFSYLQMSVTVEDGNEHDVQVYADMSGEWISGDNGANSNWTINESNSFVYLQMQLTDPEPYTEILNRAQDSILYHAINKTSKTTWQIGVADDVRSMFANGTGLKNTADPDFHPVGDPFDIVGLSVDLGTVTATSDPVVFAFGVVRDPAIKFVNQNIQDEERSSYYWSQFNNIHDVIEDVLGHYESALGAANSLDSRIASDMSGFPSEYYGILSLATRQAMGAIEYTLLRDKNSNTFNTSDVKAFMKDIGGIGSGGTNAVDVMYAAMPIYLYLNPEILGYLLSPLLTYQESVQYQNNYAARDLGSTFPVVSGNFNGHEERVEQSANMLIMALAHAQTSGDGTLLAQHYNLLGEWASFLVNNTMSPNDDTSSSSDAISLTNQTNVVLKGIVAIGAMGKIAEVMGQSSDASRFKETASSYASQLLKSASSSSSFSIAFGSSSPGFLYNLYADRLLGLNVIDTSVYDAQTSYFSEAASQNKFGIPVDASNSSAPARADWMLYCASIATNTNVRSEMIQQVNAYVSANLENNPFPILYNAANGSQIGGGGSPAVGAMFAPLALNVQKQDISTSGVAGSKKTNIGAIVGGVVGGLAALAALGALAFFLWRRRERKATGRYNQGFEDPDKIQPIRVKPISIPSDPALEPLSATVHPGMHDLRTTPFIAPPSSFGSQSELPYPGPPSSVGGSAARTGASPGSATASHRGPFAITNPGDNEMDRNDAAYAAVYASHQAGGSSRGGAPDPKAAMQQDALRSEVQDLRMEIERMKQEREALGEAPPSYDEELRFANALQKQQYNNS